MQYFKGNDFITVVNGFGVGEITIDVKIPQYAASDEIEGGMTPEEDYKPEITGYTYTQKRIFNPPVLTLIQNGYREYIPIGPSLDEVKMIKLKEIDTYDKALLNENSNTINQFQIGDIKMWLTREDRGALLNRVMAEESVGITETEIWTGIPEMPKIKLPLGVARGLLLQIELYAGKCFDKTQEHKTNMLSLPSQEEVESYDFTQDYPEIIHISI